MQVNAIQTTMPTFGAKLNNNNTVTEPVNTKVVNQGLDEDVLEIQGKEVKKASPLSPLETAAVGIAAFAGPVAFCVSMTQLFLKFVAKV